MTTYQTRTIENLDDSDRSRRINPRDRADLPESITGKGAVWHEPSTSASGKIMPPSYHAVFNNAYYPVEFINNKWYTITWDDTDKFKGYWVNRADVILQGESDLGWLGNIPETQTPTVLSQYRERAESASTQAEQDQPQEVDDEDEGVDNNPGQTELLAHIFTNVPTFQDIAEETDPAQSREHYLPTTIPWQERLNPTAINPQPIHARATTSGETIAATAEASKLITNAIKIDGGLKGRVPEVYDGDRTRAEKFLTDFELFWMNNEENSHMKNPYKRCTYFLGLCSGVHVEDWVFQQIKELKDKTTRRSDPIPKDKEELWQDLIQNFANAFTWTGKVEQARIDLANLEMKGDNIDEYVAKFENLLRKGEIPRDDVAALMRFKGGLRKGVHAAILRRDTWPTTLDGWEENARREVRRFAIMKESLGEGGNAHLSTKQAKWRSSAQQFKSFSKQKKDEAVPMEIDSAQIRPKNPEREAKNAQLRKEGRCFKCEKQGHLKKDCPDWNKKNERPPPYQSKGRVASTAASTSNIDTHPEEDKEPELKELARRMHSLNDTGKEQLFDLIMDEDF